MSSLLVIPIRMDALYLPSDQDVHAPEADFSRLPYQDGMRDQNPDIPFLSDMVQNGAFKGQPLRLKSGLHLHWALPHALTHGQHQNGLTRFPVIPNRWLVKCKNLNQQDKYWIVESDYIYPEKSEAAKSSITYPYSVDAAKHEFQPYCSLGRKVQLDAWKVNEPNAHYLNNLTAIGYGLPSFAAFYPNCFSILGLHDPEVDQNSLQNLSYELLGWNHNSAQDSILSAINEASEQHSDLNELLKERFQWQINETLNEVPDQIVYYAHLSFAPSTSAFDDALAQQANQTKLAMGDTGTEALSALLSHKIDPSQAAVIEDQLEALHLSKGLEKHHLDLGAKFEEARHEKSFNALQGGSVWRVHIESKEEGANANQAHNREQITLDPLLATLLNKLNLRQNEANKAQDILDSLKQQLFSDWYKYMLCQYPATDQLLDYPEVEQIKQFVIQGLDEVEEQKVRLANLTLRRDKAQVNLEQALATHQVAAKKAAGKHVLQRHVGKHFWQPKEPCVLMRGPLFKSGARHLQDDLLACHILKDSDLGNFDQTSLDSVLTKIATIFPDAQAKADSPAFHTWTAQPWHPLLMEWEVEAFPLVKDSNITNHKREYGLDFISKNYELKLNKPELSLRDTHSKMVRGAKMYNGRSLLSPHAGPQLKGEIERYFSRLILSLYRADFFKAYPLPQGKKELEFLNQETGKIISWLTEEGNSRVPTKSALDHIIKAYQELGSQPGILSQTLGDFHRSLLMHKQGLSLEVKDPLAFETDQIFTDKVREALGQGFFDLPLAQDAFQPLRSGALRLNRLRIIDTFGRSVDIPVNEPIFPERLRLHANRQVMHLPPRLAQGARLNFRWLSANHDLMEMNSHPATSPICGWVLPNNLDNSLLIYNASGQGLGLINQKAQWRPMPGDLRGLSWLNIENPYLRKLIRYLTHMGEAFVSEFISSLDSALEQIDPENFAHHLDLSLLMGRPIALVRAEVVIELKGKAAVDQGWDALLMDMRRKERETAGFDKVKLPLRIGEYDQLNDGLVGFWIEEKDHYVEDTFFSPQSNTTSHPKVKTHNDGSALLYQAIDDTPKLLTLLVDPKAKLHATTGILPTKALEIPPDQYASALQKIEINFRAMPILTDRNELHLTLPSEPGYQWSWLQMPDPNSWQEIEEKASLVKSIFTHHLQDIPQVENLWQYLIDKSVGWLEPVPHDDGRAYVVAKDQRQLKVLKDEFKPYSTRIQALFDLYAPVIQPMDTQPDLGSKQGLREGWLKLRKT